MPGILSVRCPCCGQVGPAKAMAARMKKAASDQSVAMLQTPSGRGRMSLARRLKLDELWGVARAGDVRAIEAIQGFKAAVFALAFLQSLHAPGPHHQEIADWVATAVVDVGRPSVVKAQMSGEIDFAPWPTSSVVDVGVVRPRASMGGMRG